MPQPAKVAITLTDDATGAYDLRSLDARQRAGPAAARREARLTGTLDWYEVRVSDPIDVTRTSAIVNSCYNINGSNPDLLLDTQTRSEWTAAEDLVGFARRLLASAATR